MRTIAGLTLVAISLATAGTARTAAPEQLRPGQPTEAHVWIENRGRDQAVPVDVRNVTLDGPLRVEVVNGEPRTPNALPVRQTRQLWEYRTITVAAGDAPDTVLKAPGAEGWETTGVAWTTAQATTLLLKRLK
jgi:hypothetical protein